MNFLSGIRSASIILDRVIPNFLQHPKSSALAQTYATSKKQIGKPLKIRSDVAVKAANKSDQALLKFQKTNLKLLCQGLDQTKYTHKAIPYPKTGGRLWNGRVCNRRIGGGSKQKFRWVDYTRNAISEEEPLVEKVLKVQYDPLRSADIALVASGTRKRWIIASDKIKSGSLIRSYADIPKLPVSPQDGDAHPVGAFAVGTVVHNVEISPKLGGHMARAAGTSATIMGRSGNSVVIKLPSKREMAVNPTCIATVGRVSNINYNQEPIGHPKRSRWFGIRPRSGLFKKKTGYNGRKINPPKPLVVYDKKTSSKKLHELFEE